jgi:dihydrofolate reductase
MPTGPKLFRYWIDNVKGLTGSIYGRIMYETMRYFDEDQPGWNDDVQEFAAAWRKHPKWVVSRTLTSVGPNATLISDDVEARVRDLKARLDGEISVSGAVLAHSLVDLIDEYRLHLRPAVVGQGKRFFAGPRSALRLVGSEIVGEDTVRVTYVPA